MEYIKFFKSNGTLQTVLLNTDNKVPFIDSGESTHQFTSSADAVEHSLQSAFVVWDGEPVGLGSK